MRESGYEMTNLTEQQLSHLIDESKELWVWMEEYRVGHKELYQKESRRTERLKITAVVASFLTIFSTANGLSDIVFLTTGTAIFTACVTSLNQFLSPEKKQMSHWDVIRKIEINQKELTSKARGFFHSENYEKELFYLQRLQQSINQFLSSDIDISNFHKETARKELARIKFEPSTQPETQIIPDNDEGMNEGEARDMPVAVVRVSRGGSR